jgi:hypothetical protein
MNMFPVKLAPFPQRLKPNLLSTAGVRAEALILQGMQPVKGMGFSR